MYIYIHMLCICVYIYMHMDARTWKLWVSSFSFEPEVGFAAAKSDGSALRELLNFGLLWVSKNFGWPA